MNRGLPRLLLVLVLAAFAGASCGPEEAPTADEGALDLVLISLDTVRRDHLPLYGYAKPTAPFLSALGGRGVVFDAAFAQEVNTGPSHASMLTGLYPHQHGALENGVPLAPEPSTLPEILAGRGYRTAAFVGALPMAAQVSGLGRGFEVYDDAFPEKRRPGGAVVDAALAWLESLEPNEPRFVFLHLYDAHGPYLPPAGYLAKIPPSPAGEPVAALPPYQQLATPDGVAETRPGPYVDRYDASIRHLDDLLARLFARIDPSRTVVVVVADHGETLSERYWAFDHGARLYDEQIRIPLLLLAPGLEPRRSSEMVETVDLLPTLLGLLGLRDQIPEGLAGRDLAPLWTAEGRGRRVVFASSRTVEPRLGHDRYRLTPERKTYAVRTARHKLIRHPGVDADTFELFDLRADPGETTDIAASHPELVAELSRVLASWLGREVTAQPEELPPEVEERLRALGYVGD